jgi:peptide/nickel transport system ATP-binding protein
MLMPDPAPLVEVEDLHVTFSDRDETVRAVNGVSFQLMTGEVLCIIGESGSGKSVMMRALMRLLPAKRATVTGRIKVGEYDIAALDERQLAAVRGATVSMVFQEPMTALDPVYTIGRQIAETVMRHARCSRRAARERALEILDMVKVPAPERRLNSYPHELSGGLRQRALIAMALACRPRLLLADEPTTALDASVQIQILLLLRKLQRELGMGLIFVTHDLGVAAQIADRVAVMYAGRIVELGEASDVLLHPRHPYTMGLLSSIIGDRSLGQEIEAIPGSPPDLRHLPDGCSFAARCRFARPACRAAAPEPRTVTQSHVACCSRLDELPALNGRNQSFKPEEVPDGSQVENPGRASFRAERHDPEHAAARDLEQGAAKI